jgi:hypothetical protein
VNERVDIGVSHSLTFIRFASRRIDPIGSIVIGRSRRDCFYLTDKSVECPEDDSAGRIRHSPGDPVAVIVNDERC